MDKIKKEIECDYTFKIILLGNQGVGKTSIVRRLRNKGFKCKAEPTIGLDFTSLHAKITQGKKIKFHLWDTAGQENFQSIIRTYYRGVACACIVIDVSDVDALDNARKWLKEYNTLKSETSVGVPIIIGNKKDLKRSFTYQEGEQWANENGCLYWEMSAKNNDNTSGLLYFIGNNIFNNWDGETESAGIFNNQLKEKIKVTRTASQKMMNFCCSIV